MPKISVIIPNYNHATFLEKRMDSIINQTFDDFEIILLDDASNDGSLHILNNYVNHPKVSNFVVNATNSGSPFKQWQKGVELSKGELIWIAESDDFADYKFLEKIVPLFSDSKVMLAYCNSYDIDDNNIVSTRNWHEKLCPTHWKHDYCNNGNDEIKKYLMYKNIILNASAVVFRKDRYFKVGCVNQQFFYSADWLLWSMLIKDFKIAYLHTPLNYFRNHNSSTRVVKSFANEKKRLLENIYIIEHITNSNNIIKNISDYMRWNWIFSNFINNNKDILTKEILFFFPKINKMFIFIYYLKLILNIFSRCKLYFVNIFKIKLSMYN